MLLKITKSPASPLSLLYFSPLPYCYLAYYIFYLFIVSPTGTWTPWRQVFLFVLFHAVSSIPRNITDTVKALSNFFLNKWIHPSQRKRLDSHSKLYGKILLLLLLLFSLQVMSSSLWPHGLQPARLLCPGMNTGVGCHFLLQGIFETQGWNWCLLHCGLILYHWATWESLSKTQSGL